MSLRNCILTVQDMKVTQHRTAQYRKGARGEIVHNLLRHAIASCRAARLALEKGSQNVGLCWSTGQSTCLGGLIETSRTTHIDAQGTPFARASAARAQSVSLIASSIVAGQIVGFGHGLSTMIHCTLGCDPPELATLAGA